MIVYQGTAEPQKGPSERKRKRQKIEVTPSIGLRDPLPSKIEYGPEQPSKNASERGVQAEGQQEAEQHGPQEPRDENRLKQAQRAARIVAGRPGAPQDQNQPCDQGASDRESERVDADGAE